MTLARRIAALERSPTAGRRRLLLTILDDAEAMDPAVRMFEDRAARFPGVPPEAIKQVRRRDPLQRALQEAFAARVAALSAEEQGQRAIGGRP